MDYDLHELGKPLLAILCYNNGLDAKYTFEKVPEDRNYDVVVNDDGSTDNTLEYIQQYQFPYIRNEQNQGVGSSIKKLIQYAKENGYHVLGVIAGNNKDDPRELERLFVPIYQDGCDYVQGSRRLSGGKSMDLPLFRKMMVPTHAYVFRLLTGFPCTDALNGFRTYRLDIFYNDARINIWQGWLDHYEFETYVHYKVLRSGYKVKEVPVTKSYAAYKPGQKYSHIRPILDWWSIMRPLFYLILKIKK